jgi:putative cardiolipin synthase
MHTEIVESSEDHQALMLDHAGEALKQRLDMIQRATTQIELESWNFDTSKSSRLIVQALIAKKKANPDISIRILVDYFVDGGLAQLSPAIADKLAGFGIELRYYNQIPMIDFPKVDHRDHRKIFVIDGSEAIIGSRNLADEHFNLGHGFNFVDRDVWIINIGIPTCHTDPTGILVRKIPMASSRPMRVTALFLLASRMWGVKSCLSPPFESFIT